jgi:hypothetical protein
MHKICRIFRHCSRRRLSGVAALSLFLACGCVSLQAFTVAAARVSASPIIRESMLPSEEGVSINGPSLIRVPDWVPHPLGRYYLYFAHHAGESLRLAYADHIEGPWKIYEPGALQLKDQKAVENHVASPEAVVDEASHQIYLFYHGWVPGHKTVSDAGEFWDRQCSSVAVSSDGIHFRPLNTIVGPSYLRVFAHGGQWFAINESGVLQHAARLGDRFEPVTQLIGPDIIAAVDPARLHEPGATPADQRPATGDHRYTMRHVGVDVAGDRLVVYFSCVSHRPERILCTVADLSGAPQTWKARGTYEVLQSATAAEGADLPLAYSTGGISRTHVHELRDPAAYREGFDAWLLFSIAGEHGIGLAKLRYDDTALTESKGR